MGTKPATRKGRPQQWDRDAILLAARAVTVDRGFDGLRFADVAAATSVPVSSLQYAFGSRDDLVREVLRAGVNDEFARLKSAVDAESDPWLRIEIFVRRGISLDDQVRREGWLLWIEYWRASLRDDVVREDYARVASSWRALVRDAIDRRSRSRSTSPSRCPLMKQQPWSWRSSTVSVYRSRWAVGCRLRKQLLPRRLR